MLALILVLCNSVRRRANSRLFHSRASPSRCPLQIGIWESAVLPKEKTPRMFSWRGRIDRRSAALRALSRTCGPAVVYLSPLAALRSTINARSSPRVRMIHRANIGIAAHSPPRALDCILPSRRPFSRHETAFADAVMSYAVDYVRLREHGAGHLPKEPRSVGRHSWVALWKT